MLMEKGVFESFDQYGLFLFAAFIESIEETGNFFGQGVGNNCREDRPEFLKFIAEGCPNLAIAG